VHAFLAATAGALVITSTASAAFLGISWELVDPVLEGWTGGDDGYDVSALDTYRIYGTFSDDNGSVAAVGHVIPGGSDRHFSLTSSSGSFFNSTADGSSDLPPNPDLFGRPGSRDLQWDTFVTIGAAAERVPTTEVAPLFTEQAMGMIGNFMLEDTGWFVAGLPPQGNTVDNRVLIAQLTVAEGVGIIGDNWCVRGREEQGNVGSAFQTIESFRIPPIPAPGVVALLAVGGLVGSRRHRSEPDHGRRARRAGRRSRDPDASPTRVG